MIESSKVRHEVHLAKREGYATVKPTEFFKEYGLYVLMLMYMIKYGTAPAGMVVAPLAQFQLVEGIEEVHKYLDFTNETFIRLSTMDKLEALGGSDLRRLKSYLRAADKGRTLGSFCQIVTQEGYVKWVYVDHYRENYRESVMQRLWNAVEANKGSFSEETGKIEISLGSSTLVKQVYEAMFQP